MPTFYGTLDGFQTYGVDHAFPPDVLDAPGPTISAALLIASEYLDGRYRLAFDGYKVGLRDQEREWPRTGAMDRDGYYIPSDVPPREMVNATYEVAKRQIQNPGQLYKDFTLATSYTEVAVSGAVSVKYAGATSAADAQMVIPIIDGILAPILTAVTATSTLSGRVGRG